MCPHVQLVTVVQMFRIPSLIFMMTGQSQLRIPHVVAAETAFVSQLMAKTVKLVHLIVLPQLHFAVEKVRL